MEPDISPIEQHVIGVVKKMRLEKGLSQRDLSVEMDVSHGFIAAVESPKERAKYNLAHLNILAKIFECSPRDFLPEMPLQ